MANITYYFDPACPFTWYTTKWLWQVESETSDLQVHWRPFSLKVLNGDNTPAKYIEPITASHNSQRMLEALRKDGKQDEIVAFYKWIGTRVHEQKISMTPELVREGIAANGLAEYGAYVDDESFDAAVEESTNAGITAAGPDIGSPVITFEGIERGFHGPVVEMEDLDQATSMKIWDIVSSAVTIPKFYEIKRGR